MNVVEQQVDAGVQWKAISLTHVEYPKGGENVTCMIGTSKNEIKCR